MDNTSILVEELGKSFGDTRALDGLDLTISEGEIFGLLGPNGSGKTTTVRVIATLLQPDAGRALVAGYDTVKDSAQVRERIGLTGQYAAIDPFLTGRENLELIGRLRHLQPGTVRRDAADLLERLDLVEAGDRQARTYSGGMLRRLDLAACLVGQPSVLILDEPTTGLDPHSRRLLWELVRTLAEEGSTVLLTTQYLEEADQLADHVAVLESGRVIAAGTPAELKARVGGDHLELTVPDIGHRELARRVLALPGPGAGTTDEAVTDVMRLPLSPGSGVPIRLLADLAQAGVEVTDLAVHRPTLDDVFLTLTGHPTTIADGSARPRR